MIKIEHESIVLQAFEELNNTKEFNWKFYIYKYLIQNATWSFRFLDLLNIIW